MRPIHLLLHLSVLSLAVASDGKVNRHLIVSSIMNPLAAVPKMRTYSKGLLERELLDLLAKTLNFTYEVRPPKDVLALGVIRNRTGTGALGQLIRREVDVYVSGAERTVDKELWVDTSFPFFFEKTQIMMQYPEASWKSDAFYSIYSKEVWLCTLIFTLVITAGIQCLVNRFMAHTTPEPIGLLVVALITNQGVYFKYRSLCLRIMWGVLCLTSIVLVFVYAGSLTSRLTAPFSKVLVDSVEDLASKKNLVPFVVKTSAVEEHIRNSKLASIKTIEERLKHNPQYRLAITDDPAKHYDDPNALLIASELVTKGFVIEDARQAGKCRFTLAKEAVFTRQLSYLFPKGSPLTEIFNKKILMFHQNGLLERLHRQYVPDIGPCSVNHGKISKPVALNLEMLWPLFTLLIVGLALSFILFVFSLCGNRRGARVKPQVPAGP